MTSKAVVNALVTVEGALTMIISLDLNATMCLRGAMSMMLQIPMNVISVLKERERTIKTSVRRAMTFGLAVFHATRLTALIAMMKHSWLEMASRVFLRLLAFLHQFLTISLNVEFARLISLFTRRPSSVSIAKTGQWTAVSSVTSIAQWLAMSTLARAVLVPKSCSMTVRNV